MSQRQGPPLSLAHQKAGVWRLAGSATSPLNSQAGAGQQAEPTLPFRIRILAPAAGAGYAKPQMPATGAGCATPQMLATGTCDAKPQMSAARADRTTLQIPATGADCAKPRAPFRDALSSDARLTTNGPVPLG